jgi:hypothetical protein
MARLYVYLKNFKYIITSEANINYSFKNIVLNYEWAKNPAERGIMMSVTTHSSLVVKIRTITDYLFVV